MEQTVQKEAQNYDDIPLLEILRLHEEEGHIFVIDDGHVKCVED